MAVPQGPKAWMDWARSVEAWIIRITPISGLNTAVDDSPTGRGRVVNASASFGYGGVGTTSNPFDVSIDASANATFVPGAANNLVPGNMLTTVSVPSGATSYAFVRVNTDGNSVQNCTLMIGTTAPAAPVPVKNALPMQVDVLLHLIAYTAPATGGGSGTYKAYRVFYPATNIKLTPILAFQTDVASPEPGASPYDNWYTWQIGGT